MLGHAAAFDVRIRVIKDEAGTQDREVVGAFALFVGDAARDSERVQRAVPELPAGKRAVFSEQRGRLIVGSARRRKDGQAKKRGSEGR